MKNALSTIADLQRITSNERKTFVIEGEALAEIQRLSRKLYKGDQQTSVANDNDAEVVYYDLCY